MKYFNKGGEEVAKCAFLESKREQWNENVVRWKESSVVKNLSRLSTFEKIMFANSMAAVCIQHYMLYTIWTAAVKYKH